MSTHMIVMLICITLFIRSRRPIRTRSHIFCCTIWFLYGHVFFPFHVLSSDAYAVMMNTCWHENRITCFSGLHGVIRISTSEPKCNDTRFHVLMWPYYYDVRSEKTCVTFIWMLCVHFQYIFYVTYVFVFTCAQNINGTCFLYSLGIQYTHTMLFGSASDIIRHTFSFLKYMSCFLCQHAHTWFWRTNLLNMVGVFMTIMSFYWTNQVATKTRLMFLWRLRHFIGLIYSL